MNGVFEWLVKLVFLALLAPVFLCLLLQVFAGVLAAVLPWLIGFGLLIGLVSGLAAALVLRRRLPPSGDRFPSGEVPRIRRPRGVRTER